MKKTLKVLVFVLLLSLAAGFLSLTAGLFLPPSEVKANAADSVMDIIINPDILDAILSPHATPTPVFNPGTFFTLVPRVTPTPAFSPGRLFTLVPRATSTPKPETPIDKPDPKPTVKPSGGGQIMTSEGPLFLSFRQDLTEQLYMFTPMDLSLDGEYHFPLIGNASQVVGDAKVVVRSGIVFVTYLVVNGVSVDEKEEFFTFFPDIRSVPSVEPSQLQHVKLQFGLPYSIAGWLNSDPNVLLYINCPVSYKTNLAGLTPFSFQDPGYINRMMDLILLMD